jgi:hypothetical protein
MPLIEQHSHGDVVNVATVPQTEAVAQSAFDNEAELFVKGDGGRVFGADEELDFVRAWLGDGPVDQGAQQGFAMTAPPMAEMDAKIETQYMRPFAQAHGNQGGVTDDAAVDFGNQNFRRAALLGGDALPIGRFVQFVGFGNEQAILMPDDLALGLAQHGSVVRTRFADVSGVHAWRLLNR